LPRSSSANTSTRPSPLTSARPTARASLPTAHPGSPDGAMVYCRVKRRMR
jgi:hypothetical protein